MKQLRVLIFVACLANITIKGVEKFKSPRIKKQDLTKEPFDPAQINILQTSRLDTFPFLLTEEPTPLSEFNQSNLTLNFFLLLMSMGKIY